MSHGHNHNNHESEEYEDSEGSDNEDSDESLKIDFSKIKTFFSSKALGTTIFLLLILIPVLLTVYIRLLPQDLGATDTWALSSVQNYYRNQIAQQVNGQYPNLATTDKNNLIDKQLNDFLKNNKDQVNAQVKQTSAYFKTGFEYQENNHTYTFLGDLDSYYWLRFARNMVNTGTICDTYISGKCWDTRSLAPIGIEAGPTLHPLMEVYLYKLLHSMNSTINLMQTAFLLPTIIAVIAAIAAFFIGRRLMNNAAGFFAAMFVSLSPLFLSRTLGSDTDVWNIMLPLVIIWTFLEAFESKELWKKSLFTVVTSFFIGLFCFAWGSGWWYIFDFLLATLIGYMVFELIKNYIKHKHITKVVSLELKYSALLFVILFVGTALFVTVFTEFRIFPQAFTDPLSISAGLKSAAQANLWPNVYTTVAELNAADLGTIVSQTAFGINILFTIALLGIIFTMMRRQPNAREYWLIGFSILLYLLLITTGFMSINPNLYMIILMIPVAIALLMLLFEKESVVDVKPAVLLTIWYVGMIFASIKGVRFILLLTPAFGVALGVSLGYIYQYLVRAAHSMKISENLSKVIVFLIICLILIQPIRIGYQTANNYVPSMTKGWWDTLTKIRLESKPDAIINSWWDFGHWFKYVADRQVTLDGNIQNHPNAHWLGRILQTDNENESIAILRMLDCGSNTAFDEVNKQYNDTEKAQNVIADIIMLSKDNAAKYLSDKGFSQSEIDTILKLTHCNPPEDYFITSGDMVGKAGVWAHFGLWDFDKAYIINNLKNKPVDVAIKAMKDRWNYSDDYASKTYYDVQALQSDADMNSWIAPWPSYAGGNLVGCQDNSGIVTCNVNMGIGNNPQGILVVIESASINLTNPYASTITVGFFDQSNRKVQESVSAFKQLIINDNGTRTYEIANSSVGLGMMLDVSHQGNNTVYQALVMDPLLAGSTFTKLFYLDGRGMSHFEKFSDTTDITGTRIIVWKVKWD